MPLPMLRPGVDASRGRLPWLLKPQLTPCCYLLPLSLPLLHFSPSPETLETLPPSIRPL